MTAAMHLRIMGMVREKPLLYSTPERLKEITGT